MANEIVDFLGRIEPEWLPEIFPKRSFIRHLVTDQRFLAKPSSEIVPKVIDFLMTVDVEQIRTSEVASTINNVGKYSRKLWEAKPKLNAYGWDFVLGKKVEMAMRLSLLL